MKKARRIYIYAIWFPTSKKYYIGQTWNLDKRMQEHLKSGSLVYKALWKYDDWQISILHTCKTRDEANRIEIEEIRNFNSVAPNGYNLTRGGEGGISCEKTKEKMSQAAKGNQNAKGSKSISGQKRSKETREKLSKAGKGRILSKEHKVNISRGLIGKTKGRKHTKETKEKMSKAHIGMKNAKGKRSKESKIRMAIGQYRYNIAKLEKEIKDEKSKR